MKRTHITCLVLWQFALAVVSAGAATPDEQAEAFFARGLAAEQRGDFIAVGHCYALALRVNPAHAQALARLKELETKNVFGTETPAKTVTIAHLQVHSSPLQGLPYREDRLRELFETITRQSGIPIIFEGMGYPSPQISFDLKNVTVDDALKTIAKQTGFTLTYEKNAVRLSPPKTELTDAAAKARVNKAAQFEGVVSRVDGGGNSSTWVRFVGTEFYLFCRPENISNTFKGTDPVAAISAGQRLRASGMVKLFQNQPWIELFVASQWEAVDSSNGTAAEAMKKLTLAAGQPDPKTDFKAWLKTVQLKHGLGDGVIWSFDDGVVLHYSQTDPKPTVQRFEIISIEPATRTLTWRQPGAVCSIRIDSEFKKYEWKGKDKPFVSQPLAIDPRDPAIFGTATSNAGKSSETLVRLQQLESEYKAAGAAAAQAAHDKVLTDLRTKYAAAVKRTQEEAKKAGYTATSDVLQEELSRAQVGADVPEKDDPKAPATLVKLRSIYREQAATAEKAHAARMKPLLDRYDAEIAALEASLTGKPDDLAAVKAVREQIAKLR